jgi:hypothetical protein
VTEQSSDDTERYETCEMSGWEHTTDELLIPVWENPDDYNQGEGPDYLGCTNCHTMRPVDTGTKRCELCGGSVEASILTADSHPEGPNHLVGQCCVHAGGEQSNGGSDQ